VSEKTKLSALNSSKMSTFVIRATSQQLFGLLNNCDTVSKAGIQEVLRIRAGSLLDPGVSRGAHPSHGMILRWNPDKGV